MGKHLVEIATLVISVALVALLVREGSKTVDVIKTGGRVFNDLLRTVTLQ